MTRRRRQLLNTAEDQHQVPDLDNIAHFEPRRETVGELLRRTREIKGRDLDSVAARLRIRAGYLRAIENGRFQDLPGSTYAVGFVRTYSDHLGLDSEDVVRRFRDEVAEVNNQTQLIFPVVAAEGKIPRGAILLLSAVLGAIAYGGWYYLSERDQNPLDLIPELPAQLRALVSGVDTPAETPTVPAPAQDAAPAPAAPAPTATAPTAPAPATVAPTTAEPAAPVAGAPAVPADQSNAASPAVPAAPTAPAAPATGQAAPAPEIAQPAPPVIDPAPPAAPAMPDSQMTAAPAPSVAAPALPGDAPPPAGPTFDQAGLPTVAAPTASALPGVSADGSALPATAEGQVFGAVEEPSRIVLVARLESWVQVTDPESNALLTRVLRAGDRYYVPDQAGLTLATGNLGGLDVWVDGQKIPTMGPVGVVRRGIALDPQLLRDGTAATGVAPALD